MPIRFKLLSIVFAFFCLAPFSPCSDSATVGTALLQKAHDISAAAFKHSLTQTGKLTILAAKKPAEGTYTYTNSGSYWREELVLPGYNETRVRTGTQEKVQRPSNREPFAIYSAIYAMRVLPWLQTFPNEHIAHVKREKVAGSPAQCVEIQGKDSARTVCVYDEGTLASLRSDVGSNFEYSEYSKFDNVQVPTKIRGTRSHNTLFEMNLNPPQPVAPDIVPNDDLSNPTLVLGWCEESSWPILDRQVRPTYPEEARTFRKQGTVTLYGIVGTNGQVTNISVVGSAGPELDRESLDAVSKWKYRPATCGATPIETEIIVTVNFSLGG